MQDGPKIADAMKRKKEEGQIFEPKTQVSTCMLCKVDFDQTTEANSCLYPGLDNLLGKID